MRLALVLLTLLPYVPLCSWLQVTGIVGQMLGAQGNQ